jgi:hypothetical protein
MYRMPSRPCAALGQERGAGLGVERCSCLRYTAEELATHVRTEFSTYSWLLKAMLQRVGFTILDFEYRRSAYGTYTCAWRNR